MPLSHLSPRRAAGAVAWLLVGLLACSETEPADPASPSVLAAKGGGGGGGPGPKVKEAVPNEAPQGTNLVVRVIGSGFDRGSTVLFLLDCDTALKMVVESSEFIDEQNLDVDVTIDPLADVASYDIEVTTTRGKKGIGSEKFSVRLKGGAPVDIPVSVTFRDARAAPIDGVTSDNGGPYTNAVILDIGNLQLDARKDIPRELCFKFDGQSGPSRDDFCDDGYLTTSFPDVDGGLAMMVVGNTMTTEAQVTWVIDGYNWFLRFAHGCDLNAGVDNRAVVTHPDATSWTLEGVTAVLCRMPVKGRPRVEKVGGVFIMPFKITIGSSQ